ncbi:hypothetical protein C8J43_1122 [Sphingomonas sp. PP-CE-1G-424]|nr:hypothetical protein C8J43_1122 [Sphingomonas sp. PP-CE-1G-424]
MRAASRDFGLWRENMQYLRRLAAPIMKHLRVSQKSQTESQMNS